MKKLKTEEFETTSLVPNEPEYREQFTYVNPRVYNRIPQIRLSVIESLRQQLRDAGYEWTNEQIIIEECKGSRKCEDTLKVTLKVWQ